MVFLTHAKVFWVFFYCPKSKQLPRCSFAVAKVFNVVARTLIGVLGGFLLVSYLLVSKTVAKVLLYRCVIARALRLRSV